MNKTTIKKLIKESKSLKELIEKVFNIKINFDNRQSYIPKILREKLPVKMRGSQMNYVAKKYLIFAKQKNRFTIYEWIADVIIRKKLSKKNILDMGCGNGILVDLLSNKAPKKTIFGADISTQMLKIAKKINKNNKNVIILKKDAYELNKDFILKNNIDLIIFKNVLSRLEDPFKVLENLKNIGGLKIFISTLKRDIPWKILQKEFLDTMDTYDPIDRIKGWAGSFNKKDINKIKKIFSDQNVKIIKVPKEVKNKLKEYMKIGLINILIKT
jgi:2-polyprenyl-3-methyl-5-hydroxy-6-metoxy-1,4-benzoquinol methylase